MLSSIAIFGKISSGTLFECDPALSTPKGSEAVGFEEYSAPSSLNLVSPVDLKSGGSASALKTRLLHREGNEQPLQFTRGTAPHFPRRAACPIRRATRHLVRLLPSRPLWRLARRIPPPPRERRPARQKLPRLSRFQRA